MIDNIYEKDESHLYSKFSKEFTAYKRREIKQYIKEKFNKGTNSYCFILIKNKENIIGIERQYLKNYNSFAKAIRCIFKEKEPLEKILNKIDSRIKNISKELKKEISFKIIIINDTKEHSYLIKEIKKQICKIDELLNPWNYEKSLTKQFYDNKLYIFSFGVVALTLTLLYRLNDLGVIINFISIDTLTLTINVFIYFILIGLALLLGVSFVYALGIIYFDNYKSKITCKHSKFQTFNIFKSFISFYLVFYLLVIFILISLDFTVNYKNSLISYTMVKNYITQIREPSIREIKYKGHTKNILLMGKDNKFISFIYVENILKNDLINKKIQNDICTNTNLKDSYLDSLIALLNIKNQVKIKDSNEIKERKFNFISNQRYNLLKIADVSFTDKIPNFDDVFCKKISNKK